MQKFFTSIRKEILVLLRDREGLALMFIMPLILVVLITVLQHKTYQNITEQQIPIVLINNDNDSLGNSFQQVMEQNRVFALTVVNEADSIAVLNAKNQVANGDFQMGIYIPEGATNAIKNRVINTIQKQMPESIRNSNPEKDSIVNIALFFDPVTKESFRNVIKGSLREFASRLESRIIFLTYSRVFDALTNQNTDLQMPDHPTIVFEESFVSAYKDGMAPNAVQHNVPAWTLFAMFFIALPIAGNIIKERNEGCTDRIRTIPVSPLLIMSSKAMVFIFVCLLQTLMIFLTGIYVMPLLDLPQLMPGHSIAGLLLIIFASAMAATGFGIAIGTISGSVVQASTFGSVSVVILAALGGVWIPAYLMSGIMRKMSALSPMNWGIEGFYEVFLRNGSAADVLPHAMKLIAFFVAMILISWKYRRRKTI